MIVEAGLTELRVASDPIFAELLVESLPRLEKRKEDESMWLLAQPYGVLGDLEPLLDGIADIKSKFGVPVFAMGPGFEVFKDLGRVFREKIGISVQVGNVRELRLKAAGKALEVGGCLHQVTTGNFMKDPKVKVERYPSNGFKGAYILVDARANAVFTKVA